MDKIKKIQYARQYLKTLAQGMNPLTNEDLPDDTVLNNLQLARCFMFSADILSEVLETYERRNSGRKNKFYFNQELIPKVTVGGVVTISEFANRVYEAVGDRSYKKINCGIVTGWLLYHEYIRTEVDELHSKTRRVTEKGIQEGITEERKEYASHSYYTLKYNEAAQRFLLEHLCEILQENLNIRNVEIMRIKNKGELK